MGYYMEDFPSASCVPSMDCNSCVQYSFCVFLVLLNGSKVCASTAELRDDKYAFETMLFSSEDCVSHLNPQKPVPGSTADVPGFQTSCEESQKLIPSLMQEQIENSIEDIDLKAQVPGPKTETLVSPTNDPYSMKKPPDCPMTIQNSAKIVPKSPEAVQNSAKVIPETTETLIPDLPLKVENLEKYRRFKSKVILSLKTVRDGLLADYSAISKPRKQPGEALIIQMSLLLNSLALDETDSKFDISGTLILEWIDRRLSFPETIEIESEMLDHDVHFKFLNVVYYEFHEIWHPEFSFEDGTNKVKLEHHFIRSNNHGLVSMKYVLNITSDCKLNILFWPNDSHMCVVTATMNSFTDKNPMQLHFLRKVFKIKVDDLQLENYAPNPKWNLADASVKRVIIPCEGWDCADDVIKVHFIFKINRKGTYFNSIHSCLLVYSVLMTTWMLVCQSFSYRKAFLVMYNLITTTIILFITSQNVPLITTSITIHGLMLILNSIVILYSLMFPLYIGIVYNQRPPAILRRLLGIENGFLEQNNVGMHEAGVNGAIDNGEWKRIASFFDRAVLYTYVAIIIILELFRDLDYFFPSIF